MVARWAGRGEHGAMTRCRWLGLALGVALLIPEAAAGLEQSVRVRLSQVTPLGDSSHWDARAEKLTGGPGALEELAGGLEYLHPLGGRAGLLVSTEYFSASAGQSYRFDWLEEHGFFEGLPPGPVAIPRHRTRIESFPLSAAVIVELGRQLEPPRFPVQPYVGAGLGLTYWRLRESGLFVEPGAAEPELFEAEFRDSGIDPVYSVLAGLRVPIRWSRLSLLAEARWDFADASLAGDFEGRGRLDLSNRRVTVGLSWEL